MSREYTNNLLEMLENGLLDYETVARECLCYMSEDDVKDLMHCAGWIDEENDDDADEEAEDDQTLRGMVCCGSLCVVSDLNKGQNHEKRSKVFLC